MPLWCVSGSITDEKPAFFFLKSPFLRTKVKDRESCRDLELSLNVFAGIKPVRPDWSASTGYHMNRKIHD